MSHSGVVKMVQPDQSQHTAALREPHPTHNYLPNQWGLHRGSGGRGFMRERFVSRSVLKVLQIEVFARDFELSHLFLKLGRRAGTARASASPTGRDTRTRSAEA